MNKYRGLKAFFSILLFLLGNFVTSAFGQDIPEDARRYMARGIAAVEMAKSAADYGLAAKEFEQAARLAPDWSDVYYNLGSVQSKAGDITSAIKSFQRYLDLAPESPDAAKVREEIFKLEYRQERTKKVEELAGVWLFKQTSYAISLNNAEFIAKGTEVLDQRNSGVTVISDEGFPSGKMERRPRGKCEVVFKGRVDGLSIKGIRYRGSCTEELSKCTIPGDQSEFTGTVSDDGNQITLNFQKSTYRADRDLGLFFGLDSCTRVTKTGEMPEKIVLWKQGRGSKKLKAVSTNGVTVRDGRFIAYDNGTVLDTRTNLMWAEKDNGSASNWQDAKNYCENYRGGGYTDWRMPTLDELEGLYDAEKTRPQECDGSYNIHVATELINITCAAPWTSETRGFFTAEAAIFSFSNGKRLWTQQSEVPYVVRALPVRSGK